MLGGAGRGVLEPLQRMCHSGGEDPAGSLNCDICHVHNVKPLVYLLAHIEECMLVNRQEPKMLCMSDYEHDCRRLTP